MKKILGFFAHNHILTNSMMILCFVAGIYFWNVTPKEEMPNTTFNRVFITTSYTGASPENVERFVTDEVEDALTGVEGILSIQSTSSRGSSVVKVELDEDEDLDDITNEIESAVSNLSLPDEVENDPVVRSMKSSKKAVIDIIFYLEDEPALSEKGRDEVQQSVLALKNRLQSLDTVSEVSVSGYEQKELRIVVDPDKLNFYEIPFNTVSVAVSGYSVHQPIGELNDKNESIISLDAELTTKDELEKVVIQGGFDTPVIRLSDVADIQFVYHEGDSLRKINGYQALTLRVTKSGAAGIITAVDDVIRVVDGFREGYKDTSLRIITDDDESITIRDRLSLIGWNGLFGFTLILILLLVFLDFKSGLWVAFGIPFSFCFTMIVSSLAGMTINNMTLAAVIIVMGMIVDDAIVVTENIVRLKQSGIDLKTAVVEGAAQVISPIFASVLTTCAAFLPLAFFSGWIGMMSNVIPPIVIIMLGASLIESLFILPSHMMGKFPFQRRRRGRWLSEVNLAKRREAIEKVQETKESTPTKGHWFFKVEAAYAQFLDRLIGKKYMVISFFIIVSLGSVLLFKTKMNFALFPGEESTQIYIDAMASEGFNKVETEKAGREIEVVLSEYLGTVLESYQTNIGAGRFGSMDKMNRLRIRVALVSAENRDISTTDFIELINSRLIEETSFSEDDIQIRAQRWGMSSGSAIEIEVQNNNNEERQLVVEALVKKLQAYPNVDNPEADKPKLNIEYALDFDRDALASLGISISDVRKTLTGMLDGTTLYEFPYGEDTVDVILMAEEEAGDDIAKMLQLPVANNGGYLVPINNVVTVTKKVKAGSVIRFDGSRITMVYGDIAGEESRKSKRPDQGGSKSKDSEKNTSKEGGTKDTKESLTQNGETPVNSEADQKSDLKTGEKQAPSQKTEPSSDIKVDPKTPLEIAVELEKDIFPELQKQWPNTNFVFRGEIEQTRDAGGEFGFILLFILGVIFMILALSLNSMLKPLVVMITIPMGAVGAIYAFALHGISTVGFYGGVGILGLAGVVVNDSIVMMDKLRRTKENKGSTLTQTEIAQTASTRMRAILLTTVTTVAGLLPTAYGIFGYDALLSQMMLAMSYGLLFGTLITLIMIPSIYAIMEDFHRWQERREAPLLL